MKNDKIIVGGNHSDERGTISFVNDFDMTEVKRFYIIKHFDTKIIRAWRGHKIERRWFHVYKGTFEIKLVRIDDWINPSQYLPIETFIINAADVAVLPIPVGYATSLRACVEDSELMVFADYPIEHAKNDDYLFPSDYFKSN